MPTLVDRYGPWALVAGASEGIGAAFARALAEAGFSLLLIARREGPLEALAAELRTRSGREVETLALDLAASDLEQRFETLARDREVGLVVYNAALSIVAPFLQTALSDQLRALDVNARGPLIAAHVFGRAMAARGRGGIVLLSSLTAFFGSPFVATYGATKAFNLSLGEALAHELGAHGIDVVVSCAGATRTPGFLAAVSGRNAPRSMSPEAVATETLRALPVRGAFIPGAFNRLAQLILSRLLPRRAAVRIMASHTRALLERTESGK
ncbi:MAG: SDR family NAD(P)-dependent oxidoreductase [Polyangiales bacterium]